MEYEIEVGLNIFPPARVFHRGVKASSRTHKIRFYKFLCDFFLWLKILACCLRAFKYLFVLPTESHSPQQRANQESHLPERSCPLPMGYQQEPPQVCWGGTQQLLWHIFHFFFYVEFLCVRCTVYNFRARIQLNMIWTLCPGCSEGQLPHRSYYGCLFEDDWPCSPHEGWQSQYDQLTWS